MSARAQTLKASVKILLLKTTPNSEILLGNGLALLIIALATSLTNGTLLLTIYQDPLRCFHTTGGVLLAVLAITDLMTGAITALHVGIFSILKSQGIPSIRIRGILQEKLVSQFTVRSSILCIVAFSFDRLIAVVAPYLHRKYITTKKLTRIAYTVCPLVQSSSLIEPLCNPDVYRQATIFAVFIVPFALTSLNYIVTYAALKRKMSRFRRFVHPSIKQKSYELKRLQRERTLSVTAFFVLCFFVLSFCPWLVVLGITSYCQACTKESWYFALYRSNIPFLYLNSAINPLIYAWRITKYRKSILKVILIKQRH